MTTGRNTPESVANGDSDTLVTQTYREVADQCAPEHLNRAILKEATNAARPRYSRLIAWTRPMAWAATVMLSVALVLELSKVPTPELGTFERDSGNFEVASPKTGLADDATTELLEESGSPAMPPGRASNAAAEAPTQIESMKSAARQSPFESGLEKRQRSGLQKVRVEEQNLPAAAASADEFELKDADMRQRADDVARIQSGEKEVIDQATPASFAVSAALESSAAASCSEEMTAAPATWLECIEDLETAGRAEEANQQRQQLQMSFPDFELP